MPPKKTPPPSATQNTTADKNISIGGDVVDSVVIAGDGNKVSIIKKFFNIFKSDAETVDQRNRRIMLGHVENFWVKGILEKSLHGAALLDLGIKEDPDALNYPWAIKREPNKDTLPAGTSMLEIFQEIGMGRSLLILGAPGSGKTTMLLALTRKLIELAREDVIEPIPVVFNLASWTEQSLANWLIEQLNTVYYVPKKTAPKWVYENKMLLLLDGLDEVKQESRTKCVKAINEFRTLYGLTALVVCSRIQEYSSLNAKFSFEGAITIQPLTSTQVNNYFDQFGTSVLEVKKILRNNPALQELAETPLMLSIMTLAYKDKKPDELVTPNTVEDQHKHLFNTYINRMFERSTRATNFSFTKEQALHYLSWLSWKMKLHNILIYEIEMMQPSWLEDNNQSKRYKRYDKLIDGLSGGLTGGLIVGLGLGLVGGLDVGLIGGLIGGLVFGLSFGLSGGLTSEDKIVMVNRLRWSSGMLGYGLVLGLASGSFIGLILGLFIGLIFGPVGGLIFGVVFGLIGGSLVWLNSMLRVEQIGEATRPGQRLKQTISNAILVVISMGLIGGLIGGLVFGLIGGLIGGLVFGLIGGLVFGLDYGVKALIQHFALRLILTKSGLLPRNLIAFLDHCVDLIFLRKVGGGYIFVHRLLMEHFGEKEREKEINDLQALHPANARAYYKRGDAYIELSEIEKAIADYTQAIKLDPIYVWPYYRRGEAYIKLGNRDLAILDFQKIADIADDPEILAYATKTLSMLSQTSTQDKT